jgi:hypothetical protein
LTDFERKFAEGEKSPEIVVLPGLLKVVRCRGTTHHDIIIRKKPDGSKSYPVTLGIGVWKNYLNFKQGTDFQI